MPTLKRSEAREIVFRALYEFGFLPQPIDEGSDLRLDDDARIEVYQGIVRGLKTHGYSRGKFTVHAVLEAVTVHDLIEALLKGTDSGGPKYRP
jgi:hypothetical protein